MRQLQRSERLIDEGAYPKLDGAVVLTITWPEEAPQDQCLDFIRSDLQPNDSLSTPLSISIAAIALGC